MQETKWIALGERSRLLGVDDVVRNTGYVLSSLNTRTQSTKRTNNRHRPS
jgi:hypothetical protein